MWKQNKNYSFSTLGTAQDKSAHVMQSCEGGKKVGAFSRDAQSTPHPPNPPPP